MILDGYKTVIRGLFNMSQISIMCEKCGTVFTPEGDGIVWCPDCKLAHEKKGILIDDEISEY